ncbi:hypothetical protein EB001_01780 [bacterium]|nr:hypothetical protein [bacterium]
MAITTVDVVTNVVTGNETQYTGSVIVSCLRTGHYDSIHPTYEKSITYNNLETKYTDRFYNNIDNLRIVDGGNP